MRPPPGRLGRLHDHRAGSILLRPHLRRAAGPLGAVRGGARGPGGGTRRPGRHPDGQVRGPGDRDPRHLAARRGPRAAVHRVRPVRDRPAAHRERGQGRRGGRRPAAQAGRADRLVADRDRGRAGPRRRPELRDAAHHLPAGCGGRRGRRGRAADPAVHLRHHRGAQGRGDPGARDRRVPGIPGVRVRPAARRRAVERRRPRLGVRPVLRDHRTARRRAPRHPAARAVLGRADLEGAVEVPGHQLRRRPDRVPGAAQRPDAGAPRPGPALLLQRGRAAEP